MVHFLSQKYEKVTCIFGKIFGKFSDFRNKPIFGTDTDTENVPECTGKHVPVFPVHFPEIIPKSETVTGMHGLTREKGKEALISGMWSTGKLCGISESLGT